MSLRHALRRWRHRPGLAVVAVLILAIGIGATTAMYSIVDAVLLRAEPWADADRLVRIYSVLPPQRANPAYRITWNRSDIGWAAWRDVQQLPLFTDVAAWVPAQQIVGDDQSELVRAFYASSTLPTIVGARPAHGRFFTAEEDEKDTGTVILSHRIWTRLFGADPNAVGTVTTVTSPGSAASPQSRRTIVGVLPETFTFPGDDPDILIPIGFHKYNGSFAANHFLRAIGRLTPDASVSAAAGAVEPLVRRDEPSDKRTARVVTLTADRIGLGDRPLWLMLAGAALLLIVACSNVAGLLLSDARSRQHETAVRLALGGTRGAILRQLMTEHAVLALAAGISGVLLASWLLPSLTALAPPGLIGDQAVRIDPQMAAWAIAAAIVTTLVAGLIPSTAISSTKPHDALKAGGREATRGSRWRHRIVVAAQFSLALVLLVGAGLFGETLLRLGNQPLGFTPDGVAVVSVARARQAPRAPMTPAERAQFDELRRTNVEALMQMVSGRGWVPVQSLIDKLGGLPGVRAVAVADAVPFTSTLSSTARVRGEDQRDEDAQLASYYRVSHRYFEAMGISIVRGRGFDASERGPTQVRLPRDNPNATVSAGLAVISEALERRAFTGSGVGRKLGWGKGTYDVIGVVANVKQRGVSDDELAAFYIPMATDETVRQIVVRTNASVAPLLPMLRQTIEGHDTPMFVTATAPLGDLVASTIVVERSRAMLSGLYGMIALLLASVGLYGLAARLVAERRREIGIRVALGAGPHNIRRLVMADAWMIVGIGLLVGVPTAIAGSRFAQGMLYGVAPTAPHVIGIAALALAVAAITATVVPAWRANRIDPATTLREE